MRTESAESAFHGNIEVTLHAPDMEDECRDVDVVIPPNKVQVSQNCIEMEYLIRDVDVVITLYINVDLFNKME